MNNTEGYGQNNIITSILAIESVAILVTNSLVFVLYAKTKKLRRNSNYYLVSLSLTNILIALVVFPLLVISNNVSSGQWAWDPMDLIQRFLAISTILHILLATIDRYLKIHSPFKHRTLVTGRRIITTLILVWLISLTASLIKIPFLHGDELNKGRYTIAVFAVMGLIPLLIILALNVHTKWVIKKRVERSRKLTGRINAKRKHQKTVLLYLALATISFVFGPPLYLAMALVVTLPFWYTLVLVPLIYSVYFINPLIYTFFKPDFREALKEMIYKENATEGNGKGTTIHHQVGDDTACDRNNVMPEDEV